MEIRIIQNITKTLDAARNELASSLLEYYLLIPGKDKALRNVYTGQIYVNPVSISTLKLKQNYEEISVNTIEKLGGNN